MSALNCRKDEVWSIFVCSNFTFVLNIFHNDSFSHHTSVTVDCFMSGSILAFMIYGARVAKDAELHLPAQFQPLDCHWPG